MYVDDNSVNYNLIGVVSYGHVVCGTERVPGIYTRVDAYLDWILSKMRH